MNEDQFDAIVDSVRTAKPIWFEGEETDPQATDSEIDALEQRLGVKLPDSYKRFLRTYGGGYFARTNVFSASRGSEWNLAERNSNLPFHGEFLAITDDETGGYYGFAVIGGRCREEVYYIHPDDDPEPQLKYASFLEYLVEVGLDFHA